MDELLLNIVESWTRQTQIIESLAGLVTEETRKALPSPDGMPLDEQLAHIQLVRREWLGTVDPEAAKGMTHCYYKEGDTWLPIQDLDAIKAELKMSAEAIGVAFEKGVREGKTQFGPYTHPVMFLQHMVWHEGYHAGLILLGLRLAGFDPTDEWNEKHIWELWRGPE